MMFSFSKYMEDFESKDCSGRYPAGLSWKANAGFSKGGGSS